VTACEITTVVEVGATGNSLNGVTVPQGTVLVGKFTSLTLAAGIARMFKSKPSE
jgi:hypothetical protein